MLAKYRLPQNRRFKAIKEVLNKMDQGQRAPIIKGVMFQRDQQGLFIAHKNPQRGFVPWGIQQLSLPPFEEVELYDEQPIQPHLWQGEYRYLDWYAHVELVHRPSFHGSANSAYIIRIYAKTLEQALEIHRSILTGEVNPTFSNKETPDRILRKQAEDLAEDLLS